jgi:opacity protein-like surface antigen
MVSRAHFPLRCCILTTPLARDSRNSQPVQNLRWDRGDKGATNETIAACERGHACADLRRRFRRRCPAVALGPAAAGAGLRAVLHGAPHRVGFEPEHHAAAATGSFGVNGAFVGGTLGYNVQTGGVVFGFEADAVWSAMKGSSTVNCAAGCETRNNWLGTVRGRIGYAFDRFLPYVTGGMAAGDIKATTPGLAGATSTRIGWTAGGGIEYAFVNKWSVKTEYLYADLGKFDCGASCSALPPPTEVSFNAHLIRFGLNYKF